MARPASRSLPLTEPLWAPGTDFAPALAETAKLTDAAIDKIVPVPPGLEARVFEAMRYAALAPGKRLRPFLVLASAQLFGVATRSALQVASAILQVRAFAEQEILARIGHGENERAVG